MQRRKFPSETASASEFGERQRIRMLRLVESDAPARLPLFRRIYAGKISPRSAIKGKCLECCGFETPPIRDCTAAECPLWALRPYQEKERALALD
jgi:hypothetical protein